MVAKYFITEYHVLVMLLSCSQMRLRVQQRRAACVGRAVEEKEELDTESSLETDSGDIVDYEFQKGSKSITCFATKLKRTVQDCAAMCT